jgi:hypothetical protein
VLVGLAVDAHLPDGRLRFVIERRQQMNTWELIALRTPQRFAVDGDASPTHPPTTTKPPSQRALESLSVQHLEHIVERGLTRHLVAGESQRPGETRAAVSTELSDGFQRPRPGEHRHRRLTQNRREGMTPTQRRPRVEQLLEHLVQTGHH